MTYIPSRNLVILAFIGTTYILLGNLIVFIGTMHILLRTLIVFYWDDVHPFKESYHLFG